PFLPEITRLYDRSGSKVPRGVAAGELGDFAEVWNKQWRLARLVQRPIAEGLMRPKDTIIARVGLHDVVKMIETEAKEMVETFAFQGADPRLGERVRHRNLVRRFDDLAVIGIHRFLPAPPPVMLVLCLASNQP